MWTVTIDAARDVTVMAKDAEAGRKIVADQPTVEFTDFSAVLTATTIDVINSEKFDMGFFAASTTRIVAAIGTEDSGANLQTMFLTALSVRCVTTLFATKYEAMR